MRWMMALSWAFCGIVGNLLAQTPMVVVVEPLCNATVSWNQTGALNAKIVVDDMNYVCGCDPLAWGQIATYHGLKTGFPASDWKPTLLTDTVYLYNKTNGSLTSEKRTTSSKAYDWKDAAEQGETAGQLMYDLGVVGRAYYYPGSTLATLGRTGFANYFGYKGVGWCYTIPINGTEDGQVLQSDWAKVSEALLRGSLAAGAPIEVSITNKNGGHAIVCDGFGYAADGTLLFHLHYGWGSGSGCWKPLSWFSYFTPDNYNDEEFQTFNINVHPTDLGCVLTGRVMCGSEAVAEATVALSSGVSTKTDATGTYVFTGLSEKTTYALSVTAVGMEPLTQSVTTGEFVDDELKRTAEDEAKGDDASGVSVVIPLQSGNVVADISLQPIARYVTPSGVGDGLSWATAATLSNDFLKDLPEKTTVYVANGDYVVSTTLTFSKAITLMGGCIKGTTLRNVYGAPSRLTLQKNASLNQTPSYIIDAYVGGTVDGFILVNDFTDSNCTVCCGEIRNCIFVGEKTAITMGATLTSCIVRNASAMTEECSLIHCTFYGETSESKAEDGCVIAGNREKASSDFPETDAIGTCLCGFCPVNGLNDCPLGNTPGALADVAPGYNFSLR